MSQPDSVAKRIFLAAIEHGRSEVWPEFLDSRCGADDTLRKRVERLLQAHCQENSLLDYGALVTACAESPLEDEGKLIGRYKLLELLGEGGMGLVYLAKQQHPVQRLVALKIIKPGMDTRQVLARFEAERQVLAMMDHPNIARIFDAGMIGEAETEIEARDSTIEAPRARPYFVMELVRGRPITDFCDREKLDLRPRLMLFADICRAVQHAHLKGIIHRDIKPGNVLITLHDGVPVVKVIDFGVAKALNQELTERTLFTNYAQMIGTPLYMSPEQAEFSGLDIDTRCDVYSLGVLLYELLTGTTPFERDAFGKSGPDEMRRMIREEEPPRPSSRLSTLHAAGQLTPIMSLPADSRRLSRHLRNELDWVVMKALEKDRNRRYESASALAADIERYLADEPVKACPPSFAYRLTKVTRRHRLAVVAWSAVLIAILASSAFSGWKYFDEKKARHEADDQRIAALKSENLANHHAEESHRQQTEAALQKQEAERQRNTARQNLYYADMRLADFELVLGNSRGALESILPHFPDPGDSDRRSWEWYYLLGSAHDAHHVVYGDRSSISKVAWSSDGKYLASTTASGLAQVWDAANWKLIRSFDASPMSLKSIEWSPDGRKLAWGSTSGESALRIWDRETDDVVVLRDDAGSIWGVGWSHDGKFVATCSIPVGKNPGNVRIWDVAQRASVARMSIPFEANLAWSVSWSQDDKLLAVASDSDPRLVWDVARRQQLDIEIARGASSAFWHPSRLQLAIGDRSGNCLVWDHDRQQIVARWKAHQSIIHNVRWTSDGSRLLTSGGDGFVKIWNPIDGSIIRAIAAHAGAADAAAWSPTADQFASGGTDAAIRVFSTNNRQNPIVIDSGLRGHMLNLAWDNQSSSVFVATSTAIVAFEAESGQKLGDLAMKQDQSRRLVSFHQILERPHTPAREQSQLQFTEIRANEMLEGIVPPTMLNGGWFGKYVSDGVLSPDGTRIAYFGGDPRRLTIRDLVQDRSVSCAAIFQPTGIAWSADSRRVAVVGCGQPGDDGGASWLGSAHVFDGDSGRQLHRFQIGAIGKGLAVAWSHDGKRIAASNDHGLCEVWQAESGQKLASIQVVPSTSNDLGWSPDDLRIAWGGTNQLCLYDPVTGQRLLALDCGGASIRHFRWSPDGRKLAAVSTDGAIRVWDATAGYELPKKEFWSDLLKVRRQGDFQRLVDERRWFEAESLLKQMLIDGNPDWQMMYQDALLQLQVTDQAGYRAACMRMLSAFADTKLAKEAQITAWVCAIRPGTLEDYSLALALARRSVDPKANSRPEEWGVPRNCRETLGAVLFRAGKYEEALQQLQLATERSYFPNLSSPAWLSYMLAMTHDRLDHAADATMWLERANREMAAELVDPLHPPTWDRRLVLTLMKSEAVDMIGGPAGMREARRVEPAKRRLAAELSNE